MKRMLSFLMALVLVLSILPLPVYAAEGCPNHPEHVGCGYVPAVAGGCAHTHGPECYPDGNTEGEPALCTHVCSTEAGCTLAAAEVPCGHACELCHPAPAPQPTPEPQPETPPETPPQTPPQDQNGGPSMGDLPPACTCDKPCTETEYKQYCPVCGQDWTQCAKKVPVVTNDLPTAKASNSVTITNKDANKKIYLYLGKPDVQLEYTVSPEGEAVAFESYDPNYVTVSETGLLHPVKVSGDLGITVTVSLKANANVSDRCSVYVKQYYALTGISFENLTSPVPLEVGGTTKKQPTFVPENASNKALTWTSDNTAVATVDAAGQVTAVGAGTATITATSVDNSDATASYQVKVTAPNYVAEVNGTKYTDIGAAFDAVQNGGTLTLLADAELTGERSFSDSKTLNLNGHTLTLARSAALHVGHAQAVTGSGRIAGDGNLLVDENAIFAPTAEIACSVSNFGTITGGTFSGYNFYNEGSIAGGTFSCTSFTNIGPITGGTFQNSIVFRNYGVIGDGIFSGTGFYLDAYSGVSGKVTGGAFDFKQYYFTNSVAIEGGKFNKAPTGDLGEYFIVASGDENYPYTVTKASFSAADNVLTVTWTQGGQTKTATATVTATAGTYTGQPQQTASVAYSPDWPAENTVSVRYTNNTNVTTDVSKATASITLGGKTAQVQFDIVKPDISGATVVMNTAVYNGASQDPTAVVTLNGKTLTAGTDYILRNTIYSTGITDAGTYSAELEGVGNYQGKITGLTFTVSPADLKDAEISVAEGTYVEGDEPKLTVTLGENQLPESDYTVEYAYDTDLGLGTATVKPATNNLTGEATVEFNIAEAKASITRGETVLKFASLQAALDASQDGDTVTLLADTTGDHTVSQNITLDLNGKTMVNNLIITGNVTIDTQKGGCIGDQSVVKVSGTLRTTEKPLDAGVQVTAGGTIADGHFQGTVSNFGLITGGAFTGYVANMGNIKGGTFDGTVSGASNQKEIEDGSFGGSVQNCCLRGGSYKINPAPTTANRNTLGDGFAVFHDPSNTAYPYRVALETFAVAQVGDLLYEDLQTAIDAAGPGDTVKLLRDVEEKITIKRDIALDVNGNAIVALEGSEISAGQFVNNGTYDGCGIVNLGEITGGDFSVLVVNGYVDDDDDVIIPGTISGGSFETLYYNYSKVTGGTFKEVRYNLGTISGGSFGSVLVHAGTITGGQFSGTVTCYQAEYIGNGEVTGGYFMNDSLVIGKEGEEADCEPGQGIAKGYGKLSPSGLEGYDFKVVHQDHAYTWTVKDNKLTGKCACGEEITATITAKNAEYDGKVHAAVVDCSANWPAGLTKPVPSYERWNEADQKFEETKDLTTAGTLRASITMVLGSTDKASVTYQIQEKPKFTLTFDTQGGREIIPSQTVEKDNAASLPKDPTRTVKKDDGVAAWRFDGWYTSKDCKDTEKWDFTKDTVTKDMTLYAKWVGQYQLNFSSNTLSAVKKMPEDMLQDSREFQIPKEKPTRYGYSFISWNTQRDGKGTSVKAGKTFTMGKDDAAVTLYAQWKKADMTNGKTGDYIMIAVAVLALSGAALAGAVIYGRKKKK